MCDPLSLLRQYNIKYKPIIEYDNNIIFDNISFPKSVKTNYCIYGSTGRNGETSDYYTLECVYLLLKNVHLSHPEYVRLCAAQNVPAVNRPDRKDLLAYLNGQTKSSTSIDKTLPPMLPIQTKRQCDNDEPKAKKARIDEKVEMQKIREQLTARWNLKNKEEGVNFSTIKSLSDTMSIEKIAAIKAKRLAMKRTTIKCVNEENSNALQRSICEASKDIISHERQWRNRNSILQSTGKHFNKHVFALLKAVEKHGENRNSLPPHVKTREPVSILKSKVNLPHYNRYDQERFNRRKDATEGFKIDTMGTYHGMSLKHLTEGTPGQHIRPKNLQVHLNPVKQPTIQSNNIPLGMRKRTSRTPIIIIPSVQNSLITMLNAKDLLQDLHFVSNKEKRDIGAKRDNEVLLQRKRGKETVPYRVIDNYHKLETEDWQRVCAVFVLGPNWQFKGWPWAGNPIEIFSKICAFHLHFTEQKLHTNISKWSVTLLNISETNRHLDRAVLLKFWNTLDQFMLRHKPNLRF